ncbi:trypsin-like peptidase domain-containing protein [Frankia sp. QA3]|uniref:trypsin-like peptidase domain-containing protein n=1 Tax=Frankia sp. QA3 TaxID=710111 RepID=UPI000269C942|nr:trypsin-like peptidase domain-containing protein [Frankia sp. QA3]EIV94989.1 trypsin-like serine protease with C-terminal PDZ domain [Frankia sp. QA3]
MTPRLPFSSGAEDAQADSGREEAGAGHDSPSPWAPPAEGAYGSRAEQPHPAGPGSSTPDRPVASPPGLPGTPYGAPPPVHPSTGPGQPAPFNTGGLAPGPWGPPSPGPGQGGPGQGVVRANAGPGGVSGPYGPGAPGIGGPGGPDGPGLPPSPPAGGQPWGNQWGAPGGGIPPTAHDLHGNRLTTATASPLPWRRRRLVAAGLAIALVSAGIGGGVGALVADNDSGNTVVTTAGLERSSDSSGGTSPAASGTVAAAAQKILPSVVTIAEESSSESGTGSGTIIRSDGHILTNNHVVSGASGGGTLTVTLQDGRTFDAQVVGTDPSSDLAIIKINAPGLTAATFGNSDSLNIGELVVAVGSPLGLNGTVTSGIVSAVHRPVRTGDSTVQDQQNAVLDAIQTDAPINPGNSGGPLVNSRGEIIGVNSAIATVGGGGGGGPFGGSQQSGNIGVGFAIPGNYAESVATQLIATGRAQHPYLGVSASTAAENTRSTASSGTGAQIRSMVSGGPAEGAGLRTGDVITKVGDRAVSDVDSLIAAVRSHAIGDEVQVTYTRNGQTGTVKARLALQPPTS